MLKEGKIRPLHTIFLTTTPQPTTTPATTVPSIHMTDETYTENFESRITHTIRHPDCPQLYTKVGQYCISVFFLGNLTWLEARAFCKAIDGDLLTLNIDVGLFSTLLQHLSVNQVTADFWIGGRYMNESVGWTWLDDTPITLGSPYWAVRHQDSCQPRALQNSVLNQTIAANGGACYHYRQAPSSPPQGHCVAITYRHYYYLSDQDCFARKSPLCVSKSGSEPEQGL